MEIREVFEPVLNFIKSLQKKDKEPASKQAAKDRLKLVLMQDRASVSPDFFEMMKQEIIDVIKKYIEIDEEALEVQLTRGIEAGLEGPALYANIPIKNVKPVAPKADGTEEIDELEELVDLTNIPSLSEEEADKVADSILDQIENAANAEKEVDDAKQDELESETDKQNAESEADKKEESEVEKDEDEKEAKKVTKTAKKTTTTKKKTTTTRKKVTTKTTTKKKAE